MCPTFPDVLRPGCRSRQSKERSEKRLASISRECGRMERRSLSRPRCASTSRRLERSARTPGQRKGVLTTKAPRQQGAAPRPRIANGWRAFLSVIASEVEGSRAAEGRKPLAVVLSITDGFSRGHTLPACDSVRACRGLIDPVEVEARSRAVFVEIESDVVQGGVASGAIKPRENEPF